MLWLGAIGFGIAASIVYFLNASSREVIDVALRSPTTRGLEVSVLTVCRCSDVEDWGAYSLIPPERVWCYGPSYLTAFRDRASLAKTSFGDTALQRYIRPVLMWNDITFAVLMALFAVLSNFAVSASLPHPMQAVFVFLALSGLAYGIFDVMEDAMLIRICRSRSPIDATAAARAQLLTRLKMLTLIFSISGLILFVALQFTRSAYKRLASVR